MLRALIIDDEKRAREVLAYGINRHCSENVKLIGEAGDLLSGVELIKKHNPDLVFLDIEMPNYLGTEINAFLKKLNLRSYL